MGYALENRSSKLCVDLESGRLTFDCFQRACLEWMLEPGCWLGFRPEEFPEKNMEVLEYIALAHDDRKRLTSSFFKENPSILRYYDQRGIAFYTNEDRVKLIAEWQKFAKTEDEYSKLEKRKKEFSLVVARQGAEMGIKEFVARQGPS